MTSVILPDPETPVTHGEGAQRETRRRRPCRLFSPRAMDDQLAVAAAAASPGRNLERAGQILAGERLRVRRRSARACPARRPRRRARRRRARGRSPSRRPASSPRRARRRGPCCRGRAAAGAWRAGGRCRAGAGRWTARRARRARPSARCRSGSPAGCAAPRRPRASPPAVERQVAEPDIVEERQARPGSPSGSGSAIARSRSVERHAVPRSRPAGPRPAARDSSSIALPCELHRQRLRSAAAAPRRSGTDGPT